MNKITTHSKHDSSKYPVEGCIECDREIGRPIILKHGLGNSNIVIPRTRVEEKENTDART